MKLLVPIGRALFAAIFLLSGVNHLQNLEEMSAYARSAGLPAPEAAVLLSGAVLLAGGLLVLLGVAARTGAALLAAFLLTAAFTFHAFWRVDDPQEAQMQTIHFLKNLSMAGGAILLVYFGSGPYSLGRAARRERRPPFLRERFEAP